MPGKELNGHAAAVSAKPSAEARMHLRQLGEPQLYIALYTLGS